MSLGEEETRTPHTHTPSHSQRRAALVLKEKLRCPARDPASLELRNTGFPGRDGAKDSPKAAEAQGASQDLHSLFKRGKSPQAGFTVATSFFQLTQTRVTCLCGEDQRDARCSGALTSAASHAVEDGLCPWRQVALLDGALMGTGNISVTEHPWTQVDGAHRRATGSARRARTPKPQVDVPRVGKARS